MHPANKEDTMPTVIDPSVAPRRPTERRPIVILTFALLLAAGGLSVLAQSDGGHVPAASVIAAEAVETAEAIESADSSRASADQGVPAVPVSGCTANGISGDMVGDASPHDVLEAYLTWCRAK
jgi:hypothetical protein